MLEVLAGVGAVEELSLEKLDGDDGENKLEERVHDQNVEHVLQGVHHAVEHGLWTHGHMDSISGRRHTDTIINRDTPTH